MSLAGLQPLLQECLLGFKLRELQGYPEMSGGSAGMMYPRLQFAEHGVKQVIRLEGLEVPDRADRFNPGLRAVHFGHRHGAIQCDNRRFIELNCSSRVL